MTAAGRVTWLGHAAVLVEDGGARLLTDPVLRARVAHLRRHAPPAAVPGGLDGVLISHVHRDHLDRRTLRGIDAATPVVVPRGASRALRGLGRDVREVAAGEDVELGGVRVHAVPAMHDGRRWPGSEPAETLGFVIEGTRCVYFAGDTELFGGMGELEADLDLALLPVWGWGTSLGAGHMDPRQAAEAAALLRPAVAAPIHWGTFLPLGLGRRHARLLRDPPRAFAAHAAELAPGVRVEILPPGGAMAVERGAPAEDGQPRAGPG